MLCDAMAGGMGARVDEDGVDTGGGPPIAMGRIADVEMNEFSFPMLYLWRREEPDSGGAGRQRGGLGASSCFVPHDSPGGGVRLVISATGKAVPQAPGLSGGYPANTQYDVLVRNSDIWKVLRAGRIPGSLEEVGGKVEVMPNHCETDLGAHDIYFTHWQGGGGYGDPLRREPEAVEEEVRRNRVAIDAAYRLYGVVLSAEGHMDEVATAATRQEIRQMRLASAKEATGAD